MKFDEITVGETKVCGSYTLSESELLSFANVYDPQWFHTNKAKCEREGKFGGLIASGWQTCGIAMRLAVDHILVGSESFASPGVTNIKWPIPVRAGDTLTLHATFNEKRRSASKPNLGILNWHWRLVNQHAQTVLHVDSTSLFDLV